MVVIIMCLDLQLPMQLVLITVKVVSSIQHYVIKYDSGLRRVGGFHRVFRFPPPIKMTAMI